MAQHPLAYDAYRAPADAEPGAPPHPAVRADGRRSRAGRGRAGAACFVRALSALRIALLTWDYAPVQAGLARAAKMIAEGLAEAGADVTVFTGDRTVKAQIGGVRVVGAAPGGLGSWLRRRCAIGHLAGPPAFRRALAQHGPFDVVEATNWYAPGLLAPRLVTRHSTPVAVSGEVRGLRARIDQAAARLIELTAARRSRGHISNMHHHGDAIARLYGIAGPGDTHAVLGLPLAPAIVSEAFGPALVAASPPELLFLGRRERRKGWDLLMAACARLADAAETDEGPDFRLVLIGAGSEDIAGEPSALRRRVVNPGTVDDAALAERYRRAAVTVAPSRYESFGLVYREALLFGCPVVAMRSDPSAREFFAATEGGCLVSEDAEALTAALDRLLRDRAALAELRSAAVRGSATLDLSLRAFGLATLEAYRRAGLLAARVAYSAACPAAE